MKQLLKISIAVSLLLITFGCAHRPQPQPRLVTIGSDHVYVDDGGAGSHVPVLFIHGNGGSSSVWRAQLAHLRSTRRAVAIDLPGFGKSSAPANADYSLAAMSASIEHVVDTIGMRRFVIVGHSYAGAVVAKYAAEHPERVAGVIYIDSAATKLELPAAQRERIASALDKDKAAVVRAFFQPMLAPSTEEVKAEVLAQADATSTAAFSGALFSLSAFDPAWVTAYTGPKLAIVSAQLKNPLSFASRFPEIPAVTVEEAGHWLQLDRPDEVNRAIDSLLAKL